MHHRALLLLTLLATIVGCNNESPSGENVKAPETTDQREGGLAVEDVLNADSPVDPETEAMAKRMGMTVAQLQMKKKMLMDNGLSAEEIAKALTMGGGPASLFKDSVSSNAEPPKQIRDLSFFVGEDEREVKLSEYIGKSNVVLVFTRGYSGGSICPFCSVQTSQLVANYQNFVDRDARVLIVYPGAVEHLDEFAAAVTDVELEKADIAAVKWPVLLDPDLKAVNLLKIAANLAQPSTFIIDKKGNVTFAYVGASRTDRPSVKALLQQLDSI